MLHEEPEPVPPREIARTALLAAGMMLVAALFFYGQDVATGEALFFTHDVAGSDIWHLNYPLKKYYADGLRQGRLPLWCEQLGTGFPLHAEGQVAALYPPNLLLYSILPLPLAFNWSILLHVILAGTFAAMLARQLQIGLLGSLLAATVFAFSGFLVTHVKHVNMSATAAFVPLLLFLLERFHQRRRRTTLAAIALAIACMTLAGHPQIAYYNLLVAGLYTLFLLLRLSLRHGLRHSLGAAAALCYALVLGLLLALPQLLPTLELHRLGPRRGGLTLAEATLWQYRPRHLVAFLDPNAFGDPGELRRRPLFDTESGEPLADPQGRPLHTYDGFDPGPGAPILYWEMTGYVGLLPLVLVLPCFLLGWRRRALLGLLGLGGISLLLALGKHGGLLYLFWYLVPGFRLFRFHDRFLLYVGLTLALMAGMGLSLLLARLPARRQRTTSALLGVLALLVCFADSKRALGGHNPKIDNDRWSRPPPVVEAITEREGPGTRLYRIVTEDRRRRVFTNAYRQALGWKGELAPYDAAKNSVDPNLNLLFGLTALDLYFQIYPRWMMDIATLYFSGDPRSGERPYAARISELFNVRWIIDSTGHYAERLPLVAEYATGAVLQPLRLEDGRSGFVDAGPGRILLHHNPDALPRAYLVPSARGMKESSGPHGLSGLGDALLAADPRSEVLLLDSAGSTGSTGLPKTPGALERSGTGTRPAAVSVVEYTPHRIVLLTEADYDGWLFLSDTYYPGWRVAVDGAERAIHRANISGRAVRVAAGRHQVVFTYVPISFRLGIAGAGVALLLLLTLPRQGWLATAERSRLPNRTRRE